jgi:predicted ATPase
LLFQRLSVFAGGFTLDAATVVAGEGEDVLDPLERLVSKSVIALDHDRPEPRFRLLEPIRQYAAERLRRANAHDELLRRHRDRVVRFATAAARGFMTEERVWSARIRDEQDNVRQALEVSFAHGDSEAALRIVAALPGRASQAPSYFTYSIRSAVSWSVRPRPKVSERRCTLERRRPTAVEHGRRPVRGRGRRPASTCPE